MLKAFVLCASCVVGAVVVNQLIEPRVPEVRAAPTAQWQRSGEALTVTAGQLRVKPRERLAVKTPHVQVVVQNAVVLFEVSAMSTVISVESGEVEWRSAKKKGVLKAGERTTVPPPASTLVVTAEVPIVDACVHGDEACLSREAEGSGLAAETALYALAMMAHENGALTDAAALFSKYGSRFPDGVFAPEASIARMVDLHDAGNFTEARAEASRFAARFADEPRADEIARWAEQLP